MYKENRLSNMSVKYEGLKNIKVRKTCEVVTLFQKSYWIGQSNQESDDSSVWFD